MSTLGHQVKDRYTGFQGTVTARCEHLGNVVICQVESRFRDTSGRILEPRWLDERRLELEDYHCDPSFNYANPFGGDE